MLDVFPLISNSPTGFVVPIPTFPPETEIGESPIVELPVKTGILLMVPPEVVTVVCAATLMQIETKTARIPECRIIARLSCPLRQTEVMKNLEKVVRGMQI